MTVVLTLGPLLFTDFEVPESIKGMGGKQKLVIRKLIGGNRVVQAMGRDDSDITWSGRFRGSAAEVRARLADFVRIKGQPIIMACSTYRYQVVVNSFEPDFRAAYEIPYSISCTIIKDLTSPILEAFLGVDAAISTDINQAVQIGSQLGVPGITSAISTVASATGAVGSFAGASTTVLSGVQSAISTALGLVNSQADQQNAIVAASGGVAGAIAGLAPQDIAASLTSQSDAFGQLTDLYQLQALLGRASVNVSNAGA